MKKSTRTIIILFLVFLFGYILITYSEYLYHKKAYLACSKLEEPVIGVLSPSLRSVCYWQHRYSFLDLLLRKRFFRPQFGPI